MKFMDNNLIFEKNLDAILEYLKKFDEGTTIVDTKSINVSGNVYVLFDQLSADKYIALSQDKQTISLTNSGKSFIINQGGYVQSSRM